MSPNNTPGDKAVLLASVDTGVDWDHPDLRDNIWTAFLSVAEMLKSGVFL